MFSIAEPVSVDVIACTITNHVGVSLVGQNKGHIFRLFLRGGFGSAAACQQFIIWAAADGQ